MRSYHAAQGTLSSLLGQNMTEDSMRKIIYICMCIYIPIYIYIYMTRSPFCTEIGMILQIDYTLIIIIIKTHERDSHDTTKTFTIGKSAGENGLLSSDVKCCTNHE